MRVKKKWGRILGMDIDRTSLSKLERFANGNCVSTDSPIFIGVDASSEMGSAWRTHHSRANAGWLRSDRL
jgi:hypothetical protein